MLTSNAIDINFAPTHSPNSIADEVALRQPDFLPHTRSVQRYVRSNQGRAHLGPHVISDHCAHCACGLCGLHCAIGLRLVPYVEYVRCGQQLWSVRCSVRRFCW